MIGDDDIAPAEELEPWERNRRLRLAAIEAEQAHGQVLVERYGRDNHRFAAVGHANRKRRQQKATGG